MHRILLLLTAVLSLAGCAGDRVYAPDDAVAAARYVDPAGPSITLVTVINDVNKSGAHSALLISASQRVVFDPAGSWVQPRAPERHDVFFGMTPALVSVYVASYARPGNRVIRQRLPVSAETAEAVYRRALSNGSVAPAHCALATSGILHGVPAFQGLSQTWFPKQLMAAFAELPGVTTTTVTHDEAGVVDGVEVLQPGDPRLQ